MTTPATAKNVECFWAIVYHSDSHNLRAKKWYRVSRVVKADDAWFELYWHSSVELRGDNKQRIRANSTGLHLLPGVFTHPSGAGMNILERA